MDLSTLWWRGACRLKGTAECKKTATVTVINRNVKRTNKLVDATVKA